MRIVKTAALLLLLLLLLPSGANAQNDGVGSADLIEKASSYDGLAVSYAGEVVGDILYRGDHAWIGIYDGANTISAYIPASEAKKIEYVGRYCVVGDTVRLTGAFHRACAEHGGDLDIHADQIAVTGKGHAVEDGPSTALLVAAGALFLFALAVAMLAMRRGTCYNSVGRTDR